MSSFINTQIDLLNIYGRYMHLKVFVDDADLDVKNAYVTAANLHNNKITNNPGMIDAGFDILTPANQYLPFARTFPNKVDFKIVCAAKMVLQNGMYNTGFYMYPRSSISKSPLRLANNVGIIDAGYRGHLMGMFDLVTNQDESIAKFERYLQICAPGLVPIFVEIVDSKEDLGEQTERGDGGFGSTGR
jgi:dUTP pyrophosphatase